MKIVVNGCTIGIISNKLLSVYEAMYAIGYDINNQADCHTGYNRCIEGFYLDDEGFYHFDENAVEFVDEKGVM